MSEITKKTVRLVKKPQRYGLSAAYIEADSDQDSEPFGDDSFTDTNFVPSEEDILNARDDDSPQAKKRKIDAHQHIIDIELNGEFDAITGSVNNAQSIDSNMLDAVAAHVQHHDDNFDKSEDKSVHQDEVRCYRQIISQLLKNSVEILARISVLEEVVVNDQKSTKKMEQFEQSKSNLEQFRLFMKSNDLPLASLQHINAFEAKLKDETFKKAAVCIFLIFISVNS